MANFIIFSQMRSDCYITNAQEISERINEQIENLDLGNDQVARHLRAAIEVVDIEIGYFQFVEMAPVFAYGLARWFAERGGGWMCADDDWWKLDGYNFIRISP